LFGTWPSDRGPVRALRVRDPDGRLGRLLLAADLAAGATPAGLSWSRDGRRLAALLSGPPGPGAAAGLAGLGAGAGPRPGAGGAAAGSFSPDGGSFVSAGGEIVLCDLTGGREERVPLPGAAAGPVEVAPGGRWVAVVGGGRPDRLTVWDAGARRVAAEFPLEGESGGRRAAFSPDGRLLLVRVGGRRF